MREFKDTRPKNKHDAKVVFIENEPTAFARSERIYFLPEVRELIKDTRPKTNTTHGVGGRRTALLLRLAWGNILRVRWLL